VINPQQLLSIFQAMEQQYGKDQHGFLDLKANITDWSVYLGLSLSTLRRNLDRLESQGLLRRERNRIQLTNE
jgi:DNA-binding MarR family transcriptional regulator